MAPGNAIDHANDPAVAAIVSRVREAVAGGRPLLVASDFDGTLSPIAERPEAAREDPRAMFALRKLRAAGVPTCVVSGRSLDDLSAKLGAGHGCALVAEHGAFVQLPDGRSHSETMSAAALEALRAMAHEAEGIAARFRGARLERKVTSIALHVRLVAPGERDAADAALAALGERARGTGLHTVSGRSVLEIRPRMANKGDGLLRVREMLAPDAVVLYAGDDTTDEPALVVAARLGVAVYIESTERPTPPAVPGILTAVQPAWSAVLATLSEDPPG